MTDAENNNINNSQTSQLLGRIEVKMEQLDKGNDKLGNKLDEVVKQVNVLTIDVTEIKVKQQPTQAPKWPSILLAVLGCITAAAVVLTLIITITKP